MAKVRRRRRGTMGGHATAVIRWWDEAQNEEAQAIVEEGLGWIMQHLVEAGITDPDISGTLNEGPWRH